MANPRASRPGPSDGSIRLEIYRVASYAPVLIRTLSTEYIGIGTHYVRERASAKGRSQYCPGEDACPLCRTGKIQWKGYFPGHVYEKELGRWVPWVVELTEASEVDVRGKFDRGQTWWFHREMKQGKGGAPVVARFGEQLDAELLPRPFGILDVLRSVYHVQEMTYFIKNPAPDRVYLETLDDSVGVPQKWTAPKVEARATAEDYAALKRMAESLRNGKP